jgi:hypothetical protein
MAVVRGLQTTAIIGCHPFAVLLDRNARPPAIPGAFPSTPARNALLLTDLFAICFWHPIASSVTIARGVPATPADAG